MIIVSLKRLGLVVMGVLVPAVAMAQATLRGTVQDSTNAPMPGVLVQFEQGLLRQETVTDPQGRFVFVRVPTGSVRVSAILSGFMAHREQVVMVGGETRDLAITLHPAGIAESVTVVADGRTYRPGSATTGTKLDLPLIETPQSVTVVPSRVVEDRQVLRMGELADNVAGVQASPGYGGLSSANYFIRGFRGSFTAATCATGFVTTRSCRHVMCRASSRRSFSRGRRRSCMASRKSAASSTPS